MGYVAEGKWSAITCSSGWRTPQSHGWLGKYKPLSLGPPPQPNNKLVPLLLKASSHLEDKEIL